MVIPEGAVSVTVTVPEVAAAPAWFEMTTVYAEPEAPDPKGPLSVSETTKTGGLVMITAESVADEGTEPPPLTDTWFTRGEVAFAATFTVTSIVP
jgi:hypothetical protein